MRHTMPWTQRHADVASFCGLTVATSTILALRTWWHLPRPAATTAHSKCLDDPTPLAPSQLVWPSAAATRGEAGNHATTTVGEEEEEEEGDPLFVRRTVKRLLFTLPQEQPPTPLGDPLFESGGTVKRLLFTLAQEQPPTPLGTEAYERRQLAASIASLASQASSSAMSEDSDNDDECDNPCDFDTRVHDGSGTQVTIGWK